MTYVPFFFSSEGEEKFFCLYFKCPQLPVSCTTCYTVWSIPILLSLTLLIGLDLWERNDELISFLNHQPPGAMKLDAA